jgi:hypothetical protein
MGSLKNTYGYAAYVVERIHRQWEKGMGGRVLLCMYVLIEDFTSFTKGKWIFFE